MKQSKITIPVNTSINIWETASSLTSELPDALDDLTSAVEW